MNVSDRTPYWINSASLPRFPKLEGEVHVDVIVVGGGISGITSAYLLKRAGYTVALLERERVAHIDTGHTTAHLTALLDERLADLHSIFGRDHARAAWDAGTAAIDQIEKLIQRESIDCNFSWVPAFLHGPLFDPKNQDEDRLEADLAAAQDMKLDVTRETQLPWIRRPGLRFPHQALFHPIKYLAALAAKIPGGGSHVFEHTPVEETDAETLSVTSSKHRVWGKWLVLATHTPLTGKASLLGSMVFQSKLSYYTSYALSGKVPSGTLPNAAFFDGSDPYYYLRVDQHRGFQRVIFGGEDHKTGQEADTEKVYRRLESRCRELFPNLEVEHTWSGQVIETNDGLPYIGELTDRQFGGTGFAGNGMTFGTLTAMMAVDWIKKRKNPWSNLFDPGRKKLSGAWDYLKENKDYPYYMVRDWLGGTEGNDLRGLPRNHGKILQLHGKKVAAYRDDQGKVTLCSPVCTHLQCIVGWNQAEQTWDCPCHGSRFHPTGGVISGPAESPLEKIDLPEE